MRPPRQNQIPSALTIAGSDSGGGAGIQADLKTFQALGVHGLSAVTCVTAQNPARVSDIFPISAASLREQLRAIVRFRPLAAKTGMLYSRALIEAAAEFFESGALAIPLVIDPVRAAGSGRSLLQKTAAGAFARLVRRAALLTPNAAEAESMLRSRIKNVDDLRRSARQLFEKFGVAILTKGGHLPGNESIDVFYDGRRELRLRVRRQEAPATHGTGCTLSAAIAAYLARGLSLTHAVIRGKQFITAAIAGTFRAGEFFVLRCQSPNDRQPPDSGRVEVE